jgi:hypothetical protein
MKTMQAILLAGACAGLVIRVSGAAHASEPFYVANGKTVSPVEAVTAAVNGTAVFQCKPVELSLKTAHKAKRHTKN